MDDELLDRDGQDGGSGDSALDGLLSELLQIMSEIGEHLIVADESDPDCLTGTNALLHLYDDEASPLPSQSLRVGPQVTDAGNISIVSTLVYMPSEVPVEEE